MEDLEYCETYEARECIGCGALLGPSNAWDLCDECAETADANGECPGCGRPLPECGGDLICPACLAETQDYRAGQEADAIGEW